MITRNQSHEIAVSVLYAMLIKIRNNQPIEFNTLLEEVSEVKYDELPLFLKEALFYSLKHYEEIIEKLSVHVHDWKFARLNLVMQAILIYSYAHYYYIGNVSKAIVINIAVKLGKLYLVDDEYKFINGILDGVLV